MDRLSRERMVASRKSLQKCIKSVQMGPLQRQLLEPSCAFCYTEMGRCKRIGVVIWVQRRSQWWLASMFWSLTTILTQGH
jgi:hypothetical protein